MVTRRSRPQTNYQPRSPRAALINNHAVPHDRGPKYEVGKNAQRMARALEVFGNSVTGTLGAIADDQVREEKRLQKDAEYIEAYKNPPGGDQADDGSAPAADAAPDNSKARADFHVANGVDVVNLKLKNYADWQINGSKQVVETYQKMGDELEANGYKFPTGVDKDGNPVLSDFGTKDLGAFRQAEVDKIVERFPADTVEGRKMRLEALGLLDKSIDGLQGRMEKFRTQERADTYTQLAQITTVDQFTAGVAEGQSGQQLYDTLFNASNELRNDTNADAIKPLDQTIAVLGGLETANVNTPQEAEALLDMLQTSKLGNGAALATHPDRRVKSLVKKLQLKAYTRIAEDEQAQQFDTAVKAGLDRINKGGAINPDDLEDIKVQVGDTGTYLKARKKDEIEKAISGQLELQVRHQYPNVRPEVSLQMIARKFSGSGLKSPTIQAIFDQVDIESALRSNDQQGISQLDTVYATYHAIMQESPLKLKEYIKNSDTRDLLLTSQALMSTNSQNNTAMTPNEALRIAYDAETNNNGAVGSKLFPDEFKDWRGDNPDVTPGSFMRIKDIYDRVAPGLKSASQRTSLLDDLVENISKGEVEWNGSAINVPQGQDAESWKKQVDHYMKGVEGLPSDAILVPTPGGYMIRKPNGLAYPGFGTVSNKAIRKKYRTDGLRAKEDKVNQQMDKKGAYNRSQNLTVPDATDAYQKGLRTKTFQYKSGPKRK